MSEFKKGDRVKFSEEGINYLNPTTNRIGTIISTDTGFKGSCVRVHWDGLSENTIYSYDKSFIEKINSGKGD